MNNEKRKCFVLVVFFVLLQIQRKILTETNGFIVFLIMVLRKYVFCPRGDLNERRRQSYREEERRGRTITMKIYKRSRSLV